jgi:hypothetical protein
VNILIIGGLLGLAVLAILGAVLLGMSEDRSEKARQAQEAQQEKIPQENTSVLPPQQSQPLPATGQGPAYQSVPATPLLSRPTITLPVTGIGETTSTAGLADLNGQVREITSELHILAQRAGELQRRLTTLTEVLESHGQPHAEHAHGNPSTELFGADAETQVF